MIKNKRWYAVIIIATVIALTPCIAMYNVTHEWQPIVVYIGIMVGVTTAIIGFIKLIGWVEKGDNK